jgi:hypothetical protein
MVGNQITNRLRQVLCNFTNDFSDVVNTSLVKNNTLITATATSHGLSNGDYITIKGAKRRVNIQSITFASGVATIKLAESHNLFIEVDTKITIAGCSVVGYNGEKVIRYLPDFYSIEIYSSIDIIILFFNLFVL